MKHKYLRELFPRKQLPHPYNTLTCADFDERDTYNLDITMAAWLYERLRYFQDKISTAVDLDFHKFNINDKELTQLECIDRMVNDCKVILLDYDNDAAVDDAKNDLFMILSKVYRYMWW